jgi:hypothetical protein
MMTTQMDQASDLDGGLIVFGTDHYLAVECRKKSELALFTS